MVVTQISELGKDQNWENIITGKISELGTPEFRTNNSGIETGNFLDLKLTDTVQTETRLLLAIALSAENLSSGRGWPDAVHILLERLGNITGVSRAWIFQILELTSDYILQDYTFEWARPGYAQIGLPAFANFTSNVHLPFYKDLVDSRLRGEWQKVTTAKMEPCWLKENQQKQGILSMLTIPIFVEGIWWGVLGFDDCEREYAWNYPQIASLKIAAHLISVAVVLDRLKTKRKQYDILHSITSCSSWEYDFKKVNFWCSADLFQLDPGAANNIYFPLRKILRKIHPDDCKPFLKSVMHYLSLQNESFRWDIRLLMNDGNYRWFEIIGDISRNQNGQLEQFAGIAVDIHQRKKHEFAAEEQAKTDPLTQLANRRAFFAQAGQEIARVRRYPGQHFAVLMLDIDHFKKINDRYGHLNGDLVLQKLGKFLRNEIRTTDLAARYGGEEFVLLLRETDGSYARLLAERLRKNIAAMKIDIEGRFIHFTVSIGVAEYHSNDCSIEDVIERSDSALYRAKGHGRNWVEIVSS
ncbi:MAG TPA: diguanylate cyclase [Gammaproteobacteria bacterium]|nr:diguanylate cyclase [Gammaproteobacteria bacterium]